jgi:hypothetical protein
MDLGLVAQIIVGAGPGLGLVQVIAIKWCIEHLGLYQAVLSSQRKNLWLLFVTRLGSRYKSHRFYFLREFCSCHLLEIV